MMYEIAIIGGGPAGISMAVEARYADIPAEKILILEKGTMHSWAIRLHYPPDKMVLENYKGYDVMPEGALGISDLTKDDTLAYLSRAVSEHGLSINYGETVNSIHHDHECCFIIETPKGRYQSRNCAIAIGILDKPNKPEYKLPLSLKPKIHFTLGAKILEGFDYLVVGGGDTAAERANYLCGHGKNVTLSYRKNEFTRLSEQSLSAIAQLEHDGKLQILRGSNIKKVDNAKGKVSVTFAEEQYGNRQYDHIAYCLGGSTPVGFLKGVGIEFDGEAPVIRDGYETNIPGLFLIGDLSAGAKGGSVNWAFNSAHAAMRKICDRYLQKISE
jgi:thioredoxin reductase (NADPH)